LNPFIGFEEYLFFDVDSILWKIAQRVQMNIPTTWY